MNIKFDHTQKSFQDAVIIGDMTFYQHVHNVNEIVVDAKMMEYENLMDGRRVNMVETVKLLLTVTTDPSMVITLATMFADTLMRCQPMIKLAIAQQIKPAMEGKMLVSNILEQWYNDMKPMIKDEPDEKVMIGLLGFHIGFISAIITEYMEFQKKMMEKRPDDPTVQLLKILKELRKSLSDEKKSPEGPIKVDPEELPKN